MKRDQRLVVLLSMFLMPLGCQPQATPSLETTSASSTQNAAAEVELVVASWDEVQEMVAGHQGKVVVVDLWSSYCLPCIREFPNLVKLHETYADQVICMSVNLNYDGSADAPPESHREKVLEFLTDANATFQNVICSDPDLELYDRIDLGAIPAIYVFDPSGTMRKRFDNDREEYGAEGFSYEKQVIPFVESLLAE